jgi:protein MpaA
MLMFCFSTLQNVPFLRLSAGLLQALMVCVCLSAALTNTFAGQIGKGAEGRRGGLAPGIAAQRLDDSICQAWTVRVPDLSMGLCTTSGLQPTGGRSVQGEPLYSVDIRAGSPQLRVIVVGGIHGDELTSTTLAMHWLQIATDDPSIAYWRFIPLLNPDGMLASPAKRMNANGVDLNRTGRDPRRWPGKFAGSEPETQFLLNEIQAFQPDLIVSIHAPYGILDFDGALTPPKKLGRLHLDRLGIYPGSVGNYGSLEHHVPVVTVELLHAIDAPTATETKQMWGDLIGWMKNRLLFERHSDLVEQGSHQHLN